MSYPKSCTDCPYYSSCTSGMYLGGCVFYTPADRPLSFIERFKKFLRFSSKKSYFYALLAQLVAQLTSN